MSIIKNILFPVDLSDSSETACVFVDEFLKAFKPKLYFLHVVYDISRVAGWYVPHISTDELNKEMVASAKKKLERFMCEELRGYKNVERTVLAGIPEDEILRFAEEKNIDLIIMPSHARKGLDKVLMGSTSEKVLKRSKCPVLIFKEKM